MEGKTALDRLKLHTGHPVSVSCVRTGLTGCPLTRAPHTLTLKP